MNEPRAAEILLVEDNPEDLELTLHTLQEFHSAYRIQVARDGAEALDYILGRGKHAERSGEDALRVILLDLKLPKIDGLEVLRHIKNDARTQTIPVVVLTSSREQKDVLESYKLGVNSYIVKPINFDRFAAAMLQSGMYWLLLNEPLRR